MKVNIFTRAVILLTAITTLFTACNQPRQQKQPQQQQTDTPKVDTTTKAAAKPAANTDALTLPVLDALFYNKSFAGDLKSKIGLSTAQVEKLKAAAHTSLRELSEDGSIDTASASSISLGYKEKIKTLIGDDKAQQLQQLIEQRYSQGVEGLAPAKPNFVPTDTRIVVNAPAFRMDVFQAGKLIKTYKVGIGYPEFPLPTGMRRADTIIFNPSWTPPDEPWVKGKFQPGQKVSGTSDLNPLGVIKIPIGMPSLIHGGKPLEKIGSFASHGCVGLTNAMVKDFAGVLANLAGTNLPAIGAKTHAIKLTNPVPVDLRYETIVAENGSLHIYRDVYERGTNTLQNAKAILNIYGVDYEKLSEQEKTDLDDALDQMNRDPKGNTIATDSVPPSKAGVAASKISRAKKGKITSRVKGAKEADVTIAALAGKGYPAPVDINTGSTSKK